jgi:threonine aldolase
MVQQTAYCHDEYSQQARALIRAELGGVDAEIFFVAGGTLASLISMSACLRSHEAVIAAAVGHIVVQETGAIEAVGHKIITITAD